MKTLSRLMILLFLFVGMGLYAQQGAGQQNQDRTPYKFLELTADQQTQVEAIMTNFQESSKMKKLDAKEKEIQLEKLMVADKPDEKAIMAKVDEIMALRTDLRKEAIKNKLEVRALLTPEQRAKFDARMNQKQKRRGGQKNNKGAKRQRPN